MKIKRINYYRFDHEAVKKRFNCARYLGDMAVKGEYLPTAVYHAPDHDRSKGHKEFVLLNVIWSADGLKELIVRGMDRVEAEKHLRHVPGLMCLRCNVVVYSTYRHDMSHCLCKKYGVAIDGGSAYQKISYNAKSKFKRVRIDLIKRKVHRKKKVASGVISKVGSSNGRIS